VRFTALMPGPLPRCTLQALRDQHTLRTPKAPTAKSTRGARWQQGADWGVQWGQKGPGPLSDLLVQQAWR
jgi:hypothetical protein